MSEPGWEDYAEERELIGEWYEDFMEKWTDTFSVFFPGIDRDTRSKVDDLIARQELNTQFNQIMKGVDLEGYDEFTRGRGNN